MDYGASQTYLADREEWERNRLEEEAAKRIPQWIRPVMLGVGDTDMKGKFAPSKEMAPVVLAALREQPSLLAWFGAEAAVAEMGMDDGLVKLIVKDGYALTQLGLDLVAWRLQVRFNEPELVLVGEVVIDCGQADPAYAAEAIETFWEEY